jgi:hypothetical protein
LTTVTGASRRASSDMASPQSKFSSFVTEEPRGLVLISAQIMLYFDPGSHHPSVTLTEDD